MDVRIRFVAGADPVLGTVTWVYSCEAYFLFILFAGCYSFLTGLLSLGSESGIKNFRDRDCIPSISREKCLE
jgi:hypothetical protein